MKNIEPRNGTKTDAKNKASDNSKFAYENYLEKGKYPFGGKMPFAITKSDQKEISYDEKLKPILTEIFKLYHKEYSPLEISKLINFKFKHKITSAQIANILNKEIYSGTITYNGQRYNLIEAIAYASEAFEKLNKEDTIEFDKQVYIFKDQLFNFKCTTIKKNNVHYKYYVNKASNWSFNENELLDLLEKYIHINTLEFISKKINELESKLENNNIDKDNFIRERQILKEKEQKNDFMSELKTLRIDDEKKVDITLINGSKLTFYL